MKALVTGSRFWKDREAIRKTLAELLTPNSIVIHGKCHVDPPNADTLAGEVALELGHRVIECPVDFVKDGPWPAAGHRRNSRMLNEHHDPRGVMGPIDLVIAFPLPGSKGTYDMIGKARVHHIPVYEYPYGLMKD